MKRYVLSILIISSFSCTHLSNVEPSMSTTELLDKICEVEQGRHGSSNNELLFYINNKYIEEYAEHSPDPHSLWTAIMNSEGICRDTYLQIMGRFHSAYLTENYEIINDNLNDKDWIQLIYGLKVSSQPVADQKILYKLVSQDYSATVRLKSVPLFMQVNQQSACDSLMAIIEQEKDPEILTEWVFLLDMDQCPSLHKWEYSLKDTDSFPLQQSLLWSWSKYVFPQRKKYVTEYTRHLNPDISILAKSILADIEKNEEYKAKSAFKIQKLE